MCLNFKIRSVFIWVAHPKLKNYRFISCFEAVGENDAYVIYCFIECGYHTLLIIWHIFDYFFVNTQFWNAKFQDVNEKNTSHLLVIKSQKLWGKLGGGQKVIWSRTFKRNLSSTWRASQISLDDQWGHIRVMRCAKARTEYGSKLFIKTMFIILYTTDHLGRMYIYCL